MTLQEALNQPGYNAATLTVAINGWTDKNYTVQTEKQGFYVDIFNQDGVRLIDCGYVDTLEQVEERVPDSDQWRPVTVYFG
jgi:hypothetical protein